MRLLIQAASFAFHNGYIRGWIDGGLYRGANKYFCVPGLNCYSCPGALGACPIGSLQAVLNSSTQRLSFYVFGFIGLLGILCGRLTCGWLCPFGFIQDLLFRIPLFKKRKRKLLPGHCFLKYLKYAVLLLFVILLPLAVRSRAGAGEPWFCEWICPSGTLLGGIPQLLMNEALRDRAGVRFLWKGLLLLTVLLLSVLLPRPFCKYLCPLGALYGLCNPVSVCRLQVDTEACTRCGSCEKACPMGLVPFREPNSAECIRCGKCRAACPVSAISSVRNTAAGKVSATAICPESLSSERQPAAESLSPERKPAAGSLSPGRKLAAGILSCTAAFIGLAAGLFVPALYAAGGIPDSFGSFLLYDLNPVLSLTASAFLLVQAVRLLKNHKSAALDASLREYSACCLKYSLLLCLAAGFTGTLFAFLAFTDKTLLLSLSAALHCLLSTAPAGPVLIASAGFCVLLLSPSRPLPDTALDHGSDSDSDSGSGFDHGSGSGSNSGSVPDHSSGFDHSPSFDHGSGLDHGSGSHFR